ncbi:MAG: reverse gyrase [Aquificae bacterium]|nr:reverse gyrase [Aquificota bacterium]
MIRAVFEGLCPNCGGEITSDRLLRGLPCENCFPYEEGEVCEFLTGGKYAEFCNLLRKLESWEEFFKEKVGSPPWSLQKSWARKVFLGRSFALLAPTGVGKTTFGLLTALFLAREGKRSYIILPTQLLVEQTARRLESLGASEDELIVWGRLSEKKKKVLKERIEKGDFRILVTTSMFLYRNYGILPKDFYFLFVDDVDSFLKTAKNIDKALMLLGITEEEVEKALQLIKLKEKPRKTEEDWEEIKKRSEELREVQKRVKGVMAVSSATGNPRSSRIKLFRELLGFEVGKPVFFLRNIEDLYEETPDPFGRAVELAKEFGKGGLVFLSSDYGKEKVEELKERLLEAGVKAITYEEDLSPFEREEVDVVVGIASYRNPLARGIDLPHVVRYALFVGVPKIRVPLRLEASVSHLLWALLSVRPLVIKDEELKVLGKKLDQWIQKLRRYSFLSEEFVERTPDLKERIEELKREVLSFLEDEKLLKKVKESEEITLRREGEGYELVVADVTGYLQASGRTSRMYAGGLTKGLSYLLVEDRKAFRNLEKKVRWFNQDITFRRAQEVNISSLLREIEEERKRVKEILEGKVKAERKEQVRPVLVVVESPNKARTIASFFGKPVTRKIGGIEVLEVMVGELYLMITASLGHVLDLVKEKEFHGVAVRNGEYIPIYEVIEGKEKIVEGLRDIAQEVETVLVATDPDTEGEKIGWDLGTLLSPFMKNVQRIEFHEVTRKAIRKALSDPRGFNENLVKAQLVRRIADRWVGFEVSRILQSAFEKNWLSGGRVQIPVLGWIIEREKEYRKKKHVVQITFKEEGRWLRLEYEFGTKKEAKEFYENLKEIEVELLEEREEEKNPLPPFTTDTLLKEASDRYRFSVPRTMQLAQELFEGGLITYHRTDSTRVSDTGIGLAREWITEELGEDLFRGRSWGEGGAHECIRPTKPLDVEDLRSMIYAGQLQNITREHLLLYELVFRRFMASQMRPVKVKVKRVRVKALDREKELTLLTDVLSDGWNRLYPLELNPDLSGRITVEDRKELKSVPRAYLYTQGSLVEEMKKRGIGRPSTYASTVEKLLERGYVIERNGFLIPTKLGKQVYEFLKTREKIMPFVSEEFTRKLESLMDRVEEGKEDYREILGRLYREVSQFEKVLS